MKQTLKELAEEIEGMSLRYKVQTVLRPKTWSRIHKFRRQRITRGYSDKDMWSSGTHLMTLISESLKWHESKGVSDFEYMFKMWVDEGSNFGYKNLKQVYTDIDNYLKVDRGDWATGLAGQIVNLEDAYITEGEEDTSHITVEWREEKTGKKLTDARVKKLMHEHHAKVEKLHSKAVNAMTFWAHHARQFWD